MTWPLVQVRHVARFRYGSSLPVDGRVDGDIAVYGSNGPVGLHDSCNTRSPVIVVGRKGSHGKVRYSSSPVFAIDTTYYIDPTCTFSDIRWLYYALSIIRLDIPGHDVGVPGLNRDQAYSQFIPLPPYKVQRMIADHLDIETARIDALILKKQRMLDVLVERREAVIIAAMSGVLTTMSDDGRTRERRPLRAYADIDLGRQRAPQYNTGPYMTAYLRAANVQDGRLDLSDVKSMNFGPTEQARFSLRAGDVLISEGSGSLASIGATAVWDNEIDGIVCFQNTLLRLRPRRPTDPRFLAWWCRYAYTRGLFASVATGANIYHLSADRIRSLPMAHVPIATQRTIADHLDTETERIKAMIDNERRVLDLLAERRQALITSVVTGEMPVPGIGT